MNSRLNDILHNLPAGLTEADLVDMVDGDVPPQREALVIDALQQRPAIGLLVKQMRADQARVQAMAELTPAAPTNLLEGIQAKLDRDALAELVQEAEEASAPIPFSQAPRVSGHGGIIRVLAESPWARRFATAASLAIVAAIGAVGIREVSKRWPSLPGTVNVVNGGGAESTSPAIVVTPAPADESLNGTAPIAAPTELATAEQPLAPEAPAPLTAAQALAMAREGRLVVTVRSARLGETLRHLEGLSRTAAADVRWRAYDLELLPSELATLSTPRSIEPAAVPDGPAAPLFFAGTSSTASTGFVGPVPAEVPPRLVVKSVHVIRMAADATRLTDLVRDLNITRDQVAEFHLLPAPIEHGPSLEPESVLWWSGSSESWTPRIMVPIVVETIE